MTTVTELDAAAAEAVSGAVAALAGRRIAVLTGAGVSTDSGIPDYRGKGAPVRTPMTVDQFLASAAARRRYWVGSHLGWRAFAAAAPNAGHLALADLEERGVATGVITQNVDGLHVRAGSRRVVELHGTMRRVFCTHCGQVFDRRDLAERVEADNPWITVPDNIALGPDGDVLPESTDGFVIPACSVCGGVLKPDVVFFGEFIPPGKFREAEQLRAGQRCPRDRGLLARGQLRHPAARARAPAAAARHHRESRGHARRQPGDREDRRGHERGAARPRRRACPATVSRAGWRGGSAG